MNQFYWSILFFKQRFFWKNMKKHLIDKKKRNKKTLTTQ